MFPAVLALCAGNSQVTGEFPSQRPVTQSFHIFFELCLNKRLSKQSWGRWFEMSSPSLWRHCNDYYIWQSTHKHKWYLPLTKYAAVCQNCDWDQAQIFMLGDVGMQCVWTNHYGDIILIAMASQITSLTIVYSTVYLDADQRTWQLGK